jgi:RsiW-degrading membrane proteinase PrsW (M82 family)
VPARGTQALHHRSILQPHEPAFWVFVVFVVYGGVRMTDTLLQLSQVSRSGWALSWLLLILYALPAFVVIYRLDLYEREPMSLAIGAFAWGALAATALALEASGWDQVLAQTFGASFAARWGPAIAAPLVEETLKGSGLVLLYLIARDEVDDVMDGFVYGALCGLGFAVVEDVVYFMAAFGGTPAGVLRGFYVRVLSSGLYGHVLYTSLTGMGIGYVVSRRRELALVRRLVVGVGLFAAGVLGHVIWNAPVLDLTPTAPIHGGEWLHLPLDLAVKGVPLLVVVTLAVRLARGRERRWLDDALALEVGCDGISTPELEVLRAPVRRRAAVAAMRRRAGRGAADLLRRLQREQVNLAMLASRVATPDDPALAAQRAYCRSLRMALDAIPAAAAARRVPAGR